MERITFSHSKVPVTVYNVLGPVLGLLGLAKRRVSTTGKSEWVSVNDMTTLVKSLLPKNIKGQVNDEMIREKIQTTPPEHLTDIAEIVSELSRKKT